MAVVAAARDTTLGTLYTFFRLQYLTPNDHGVTSYPVRQHRFHRHSVLSRAYASTAVIASTIAAAIVGNRTSFEVLL
jgi:hypothetical protein